MQLSSTWFTEHLIDFEYKKYQLLGYLNEVRANFSRTKIYPSLSELIGHYQNLISFRSQTRNIETRNKSQLVSMDWEKLRLNYVSSHEQSEVLDELNQIADYAIPMLKNSVEAGKELYEFVESQLKLAPVGLTPLKKEEGYLMLQTATFNFVDVFQYRFSFYQANTDRFRTLATTYLGRRSLTFFYTPDKIKSELLFEKPELPNPAVYCITATSLFPMDETFLPVAKRFFVSKIS